jgi:signal peptidase II
MSRALVVRVAAIALLVLVTIGMDQTTKELARTHLRGHGTVRVVGDVLILRYVENEGAFLSLGSRLPAPVRVALFVAFPIAALAWLVIAMVRSSSLSWRLLIGLSIIAGGGFGNLVDRVFRGGRVSDFLNLGIGSFRTGIFNVADMAILAGCVLLLLSPAGKPSSGETTKRRAQ